MALLASWWSRQTHSLHSWFNCLCRCWRPYTGSKQWQRQQLNRPQDQAEHQTQVLVGVTVPPPPPLLAVTTHRMGRATTHSYSWRPPKPFQSVAVSHGRMGAMAAAALWECSDSNSELAASLAGDLWRHLMGHFGSLGPFPGKPLLAVLGLLDDSRGPDTVCGRVSQKNGRSWASKK